MVLVVVVVVVCVHSSSSRSYYRAAPTSLPLRAVECRLERVKWSTCCCSSTVRVSYRLPSLPPFSFLVERREYRRSLSPAASWFCFTVSDSCSSVVLHCSLLLLLPGGSLADVLSERTLSVEEIFRCFAHVCNAVAVLHAQRPPVAHRDIRVGLRCCCAATVLLL